LKRNLGGLKPPFAFNKDQRIKLLRELPRQSEKDKEAAGRFIDAAQCEIENFLFDIDHYITSPKQHKEKLEQLAKASMALRTALDGIPADTGALLHAAVFESLWCEPHKGRHMAVSR
jgi:hypothetical protein